MDSKDIMFCPKCGYNFRNDENSSQLNSANKKEDIISHFLRCGISMTEGKKTVKKQCHTCHKTFATQATLDSHRLFCDPSTLLCNFVAPSTTAPTNKVKKQPKKRPTVECPICHKVLNQKAYLANHMNTHTGERPHKVQCKKNREITFHQFQRVIIFFQIISLALSLNAHMKLHLPGF